MDENTPNFSSSLPHHSKARLMKCDFCEEEFPSRNKFKSHQESCASLPKCMNCDEHFQSKTQEHDHLRTCYQVAPSPSTTATQEWANYPPFILPHLVSCSHTQCLEPQLEPQLEWVPSSVTRSCFPLTFSGSPEHIPPAPSQDASLTSERTTTRTPRWPSSNTWHIANTPKAWSLAKSFVMAMRIFGASWLRG